MYRRTLCRRLYSAWIKRAQTVAETQGNGGVSVDVERLFTRSDIQRLLKKLTGLDLEGKVFNSRKMSRPQRSHFALMTDEAYQKTVRSMRDVGVNFLQFVPVLEPRRNAPLILAKDQEIDCFDDSKYIFTDLSFGLGAQIRSVVVRETDGTLRTATPEERDRMSRVYKGHPHRPIYEPPLFKDPYLQMALERDDHEYVLDWACHYYLPNDPVFIKLCHTIFDRTVEAGKFSNLYSTRHFGPFVFYLVLNKQFPPLLNFYAAEKRSGDAANLIRLIKTVFLDEAWSCRMENADDQTVLQEYAKENAEYAAVLSELINLTKSKQTGRKADRNDPNVTVEDGLNATLNTSTMDKQSFASTEGPLGEMAKDYDVRVVRGSFEALEKAQDMRKPHKRKNQRNAKDSDK